MHASKGTVPLLGAELLIWKITRKLKLEIIENLVVQDRLFFLLSQQTSNSIVKFNVSQKTKVI